MVENEIDPFGAFDFGDEKLEQPKPQEEIIDKTLEEEKKDEEKEEVEDKSETEDKDDKETKEDDDTEPTDETSSVDEEEKQNESLDDDDIIKKYGEDVNPVIVRHYDAIKDRLLLDEDFEFNGKNIDEAYEQDSKNRNVAIAQNLINKLPEKAKAILEVVLKSKEDVSSETFDKILEISKKEVNLSFDTEDDVKNTENAKEFLTSIYKEKGLKDRVIKSMLEDLEDEDELIAEAKKEKQEVDSIAAEEKQKLVEEEIKKANEQREAIRTFKSSIEKTLEEVKYSKEKIEQIKKTIFTVTKENDTQLVSKIKQIYTNPKALILLADLVNGYDEKTGSWKFDKFENQIKTEKIKEVKKSLEEKLSGGNGSKNTSQTRRNTADVDWDEIEIG